MGFALQSLRTSSDPRCPSAREIRVSQTHEYFIIARQGLCSHRPGAGGRRQLRSQGWLSVSQHMPALGIITPLPQTSSAEKGKVSEMREHNTGPLQRIFDGASQLGFPNSLPLCSLRATWARCSPSPELPCGPSSTTEEQLRSEAAWLSVSFS